MIFFLYKKANNFVHLSKKFRSTQISDCCLWLISSYINNVNMFSWDFRTQIKISWDFKYLITYLISHRNPPKNHHRNPQKTPNIFSQTTGRHPALKMGSPGNFMRHTSIVSRGCILRLLVVWDVSFPIFFSKNDMFNFPKISKKSQREALNYLPSGNLT